MIQPVFTFDKLLQRLQLDKEETPFVIWHKKDLFGTYDNPVKIDIPCLFFCLDGEMQLDINLQPYRFNREHLLCFITPCACRIVSRSPGFRCVGLLLSKSFWRQLVFAERTLGKIAIRDAFITVDDDEHERLTRFYELLCLCADAPGLQDFAGTLYPLILVCSVKCGISVGDWKTPPYPCHTVRRSFMISSICYTLTTASNDVYHFMLTNFH